MMDCDVDPLFYQTQTEEDTRDNTWTKEKKTHAIKFFDVLDEIRDLSWLRFTIDCWHEIGRPGEYLQLLTLPGMGIKLNWIKAKILNRLPSISDKHWTPQGRHLYQYSNLITWRVVVERADD